MAVTTKILFPATSNSSTTDFSLSGLQLHNQDDLDVYVTKTTAGIAANNNKRILHFRQSSSSNVDANHNQVNNTDGLYFPAITHTGGTETLENYQIVNNNGTVRFNSALPSGAIVFVERRTRDEDGTYTAFASGSTIRARDLNDSAEQSNFTAQEARNKSLTIEGVLFDGDQPNTNFVTSSHIVDGSIVNADVNASAAIDGTKVNPNFGSQNVATTGTVNGVSTTELSILDGATVTTSELNTLDGITASTAELNKLDGVTSTTSELNILDGVTASTAEINKLDGVTASTAELNLVDGLTASTTELNKLDGVTASTAELNLLDGVTSTTTELNILDGVTASTAEINKLDGVTASTAELNLLDGVTATTTELNLNDGQTATPTEVNILDGATLTTNELNKLDGYTGSTADLNEVVAGKNVVETISGSATDAQIPTAQAVNERVVELVTEVGGFHPIANETSFPATNPDINDGAGTIVSIKALSSSFTTGSGVTTKVFTNGAGSGNNVTITGLTQSTTYPAGRGMLLETTSTLHTYTFHRLTLDETGVADAQAAIDDFDERYYGALSSSPSTRPSGANRQNGDLFFNTSDGKMKVYNGSHASGTWDDVAAPGNFFINTLSSSSGSGGGSATFNNTATRFTLSNAPLSAQQLLVSINGVVQKPNSGTSPSEGFAIDGADIIFASAPNTGASFFIVTIGSSVNIGTPSDNTVTSAKIVDGTIVNADLSSSAAIASSKLAKPIDLLDNEKIRLGTGNDLEIYHSGSFSIIYSPNFATKLISNEIHHQTNNGETMLKTTANGAVQLFYDNSQKLATSNNGVGITGNIYITDSSSANNGRLVLGATSDLQIYHDGNNTYLDNATGYTVLNSPTGVFIKTNNEHAIDAFQDGAVKLYFNNSQKFETLNTGGKVTGDLTVTNNIFLTTDNTSLRIGASEDLQMWHNNTDGYLVSYTGDLNLQTSGSGSDDIILKAHDDVEIKTNGGDLSIKGVGGAGAKLYYNGSQKFESTSSGVSVIGDIIGDGRVGIGHTSPSSFSSAANKLVVSTTSGNCGISINAAAANASSNVFFTDGTGSGQNGAGRVSYSHQDDSMGLWTASTQRLLVNASGITVTGTVTCDDLSFIPSGTKMLFQQTAAPSGWTKSTSHNNKALRIVSGSVGSGGSTTFADAFNANRVTSGGSVASHTLTTSEIPSHNHSIAIRTGRDDDNFSFNNGFSSDSNTSGGTFNSNNTGGGQGHSHGFTNPSFNLNVAYVDVIICTKD